MPTPLIETETLADSLEEFKIFDIRWKLGEPEHGRNSFLKGHIPEAVFVDLDTDLSAPPGPRGRHPLPDPQKFVTTLSRLGLSPSDHVVVYDDANGTVAARMWWMLTSMKHPRVQLLNGGFETWTQQGRPVETGEVTPIESNYPGPISFSGVVDAEDLGHRNVVDVRAPERYRGEFEPVDSRAGHIPGAVNFPADDALKDGKFRPAEELREMYRSPDQPVMSCGSGVVACHSALSMVLAGRPLPDVYIGSFSEWSISDRPIKKGPSP